MTTAVKRILIMIKKRLTRRIRTKEVGVRAGREAPGLKVAMECEGELQTEESHPANRGAYILRRRASAVP